MTYDGENLDVSLFVGDGVHLNREGQKRWAERIVPVLEVIEETIAGEAFRVFYNREETEETSGF
jgi:hypothetical protein